MKLIYYFMKFILLLHKINTCITLNNKTKSNHQVNAHLQQ